MNTTNLNGGYNDELNRSNRSKLANSQGKFNATSIARILNSKSQYIIECFEPCEWHHSGARRGRLASVRKTNYYDLIKVESFMKANPTHYAEWLAKKDKTKWEKYNSIEVTDFVFKKGKWTSDVIELCDVKVQVCGAYYKIEHEGKVFKKKQSNVNLVSKVLTKKELKAMAVAGEREKKRVIREALKSEKRFLARRKVCEKIAGIELFSKLEIGDDWKCWAAIKSNKIVDFKSMRIPYGFKSNTTSPFKEYREKCLGELSKKGIVVSLIFEGLIVCSYENGKAGMPFSTLKDFKNYVTNKDK